MTDFADKRWEEGIAHHPESEKLVELINELDSDCSLDFQLGGDGDTGETIAYFLDELIDQGKIKIQIL